MTAQQNYKTEPSAATIQQYLANISPKSIPCHFLLDNTSKKRPGPDFPVSILLNTVGAIKGTVSPD
jgi:hypothetical protein